MKKRNIFFLIIISATFFYSSCKKDKTTGHVYCTVNYSGPSTHTAYTFDLYQVDGNGHVLITEQANSSGTGTLDFGEVNPGNYELSGKTTAMDSTGVNTLFSDHTFQVIANKDITVTMDQWH